MNDSGDCPRVQLLHYVLAGICVVCAGFTGYFVGEILIQVVR